MRTKWLLIAAPVITSVALAQSAFWVPTYDTQLKGNPERSLTFLRASIADAKELNPIISAENAASEVMDDTIFEGLVHGDETMKLVPSLADHWEITEEAYLAVLPDRKLPDGSAATAERLLSVIRAAQQNAQLGGVESSILSLELEPAQTQSLSASALVDNEKGKKEPVSVDLTIDVPERVKFRLSKVEPQLWKKLEAVLGASYFQNYPFADRFHPKKPEQLAAIRDQLPDLLGIGEHNPILTFYLRPGIRWQDGVPFTADDVKFTYDALVNPKNVSPRASSYEPVKRFEVVNPLLARIVYKRLYASAIIDWSMGIIPKHLLDDAALEREMNRRAISPAARATQWEPGLSGLPSGARINTST